MAMRKIKPRTREELHGPMEVGKESKEKIWPQFRIELVHLPEAKKWKIGEEYTITLKVKQVGLSISKFQNDAEFEIHGIDPHESSHNDENGY